MKAGCRMCCTLLALVVCVSATVAHGQIGNAASPAPLGKLIDVGGYRVHLYCTGTGSPAAVIVGAGFSFDWGLVQPEVAKFTQVCSYDHSSGIGWSDPGPKDSCSLRAREVHTALKKAGITGPYVLVGHSLGGLVARVYAGAYPDEAAGMVFVDHAMFLSMKSPAPGPSTQSSVMDEMDKMKHSNQPQAPSPGGGIQDVANFSKLPARDLELHRWAMSQPQSQEVFRRNAEIMPECGEKADALAKATPYPLGDKPVVDVSTGVNRSPQYVRLQTDLLSLSRNSKEMIASESSHFVMIDRPDVVVDAFRQAVESVRNKSKLSQ